MAETAAVTPIEIVYSGMGAFALRQSNWIDARVLAASTAETFQAPALARFVLFSANGDFYAKLAPESTAAAIPAADVTDGTAAELNPVMRAINELEYISLIAPAATVVTMQFYRS